MLRTYRRAAGGEQKAQVKPNKGFMQQLMHYVEQASGRKNYVAQQGTARRRRSQTLLVTKINRKFFKNGGKMEPKSSKNGGKNEPGGTLWEV